MSELEQIIGKTDPAQMIAAIDLYEMLDQFRALKERKKELETTLEEVNGKIEIANDELVKKFVESETEKVTKGGFTYSMGKRIFASPADGCKEKLYRWLKRHGYRDLVKETVNAQTLTSQVKEWKEADPTLSEIGAAKNYLKIFEKVTIGIRKGKA
jgi:methionine synthase II (cobalamin-independent)